MKKESTIKNEIKKLNFLIDNYPGNDENRPEAIESLKMVVRWLEWVIK